MFYRLSVFILLCTITFGSCNKAAPAGFWNTFHKAELVSETTNQNTNGGHRAMHWKFAAPNTFSTAEMLRYATDNGWKFVDSISFNEKQTEKWLYDGKPVFPLSYEGIDTTTNNSIFSWFPRWWNGPLTVYRFKTGWLAFDPGTNQSLEVNGFILLNPRRDEMALYHLWGE